MFLKKELCSGCCLPVMLMEVTGITLHLAVFRRQLVFRNNWRGFVDEPRQ